MVELTIVLVIMGVLAAVTSRVMGESINHQRFRASLSEMKLLKTAIIGDPELVSAGVRTDFGFVGDIGRFPNSLSELVEQGALPAWNATTGMGWQGPYIERGLAEDPDAYRRDGWGNLYGYCSSTGIITSLGSDGAAGGSGYAADFSTENLTAPLNRRLGTLRGVVTDVLGNPLIDTATLDVRVRVFIPAAGAETFLEAETDASGVYHFTGIPIGNRRLRAVVGGTLHPLETAVVISGVGSRHDLRVAADLIAPQPPSALSAGGVPFSHINLSWTSPTQNADGTSLIDLAGFNIYRNTSAGFTPAPANRLATLGLVNGFTDFTAKTKYHYHYLIRAFDEAGNESANSTTVSASTASGPGAIRQVARATHFAGSWGRRRLVVGIRNFSLSAVTVTRIRLSWMGGGPTRYSGTAGISTRIPTSAGWSIKDDDLTHNGSTAILDTDFTLTASGTTDSEGMLRIRFNAEIPPGTAITIELTHSGTSSVFDVYW